MFVLTHSVILLAILSYVAWCSRS